MHKDQYPIIAGNRQNYDQLLWQTPVLSLTAQAFLLAIILGSGTTDHARLLAALLSLITSLASIILMYKHRYYEVHSSKCLEEFENEHKSEGYDTYHAHKKHGISLFIIWIITLSTIGIVSLIVLIFPSYIK